MSGSEWIQTEHARLRIRDDGIAEIQHHDGVQYRLEIARAQIAVFTERLAGRRVPLLIVPGSGFKLDGPSRDFLMGGPEIAETFTCGALLFDSRVESMSINVFLKVGRPVVPMKSFSDERKALAWMRAHS